jgi:predicted AlkP superfamily phosphohydrolase/phosphomutase
MLVFIAIILVSPVLIAAPVLNDAQLCQAAIATNNGHSARAVKVLSSQDGIVEVSYLRLSDRKHFKFWCKIEPTEIRWKDEYIGRWSKNLRVYYKTLDKKTIEIRSVIVGEENYPDIKSFSHKDFK